MWEFEYLHDIITIDEFNVGDMTGVFSGHYGFVSGELTVDVELFYNVNNFKITTYIEDCTLFIVDKDGEVIKQIDQYDLTEDQKHEIKQLAIEKWRKSL